jgi:hypothetical protein
MGIVLDANQMHLIAGPETGEDYVAHMRDTPPLYAAREIFGRAAQPSLTAALYRFFDG